MPFEPKRTPTDNSRSLTLPPVVGMPRRGAGRPPRVAPPTPPAFEFGTEYEEELYSYFIQSVQDLLPKLEPLYHLMLPLAAGEYIKLVRLLQSELKSGELVTMARQHPSTFFMRYMDSMLGATRKGKKDEKPADDFDLSKLYS